MKRSVLFGILMLCSAAIVDAATVAHKGIVPIIGTTIQSFNAVGFDTSIRLIGKEGLRGRLVFHPAGQVASDSDPSVTYSCAAFGCLQGGAGMFAPAPMIGSLDIIPDPDSDQTIPIVFSRITYSSPSYPVSIKPIGADVPRIIADEWFHDQQEGTVQSSFLIPNLGAAVREKLGFRTLTATTYSVTLIHSGAPEDTPIVNGASLPADYTMFLPIEQVIGRPLGQGDDVRVDIQSGSAIGFYSYTQNITNEPDVVVAAPSDTAAASTVH